MVSKFLFDLMGSESSHMREGGREGEREIVGM